MKDPHIWMIGLLLCVMVLNLYCGVEKKGENFEETSPPNQIRCEYDYIAPGGIQKTQKLLMNTCGVCPPQYTRAYLVSGCGGTLPPNVIKKN